MKVWVLSSDKGIVGVFMYWMDAERAANALDTDYTYITQHKVKE